MSIKKTSYILIGGVLLIVVLYTGVLILLTWPINELTINKSGAFGDSFGFLTSLFSGLAFAGLIITILMQRDELALQREELKLTRKEFKGQKEELRIQNKTMKIQKFENTFFQMLSLHNEILDNINIDRGGRIHSGREAFYELYRKLVNTENASLQQATTQEEVNRIYHIFFEANQNEIGHYFRNLYSIIKFVNYSEIEDKKLYTNLVRAQLSSKEMALLFYNCLSSLGREKFKPFVEEYKLLKALPNNLISNFDDLKELYEENTFA